MVAERWLSPSLLFNNVQFEGFLRQVDEAISALGGRVLPKLNWSAPKVRCLASHRGLVRSCRSRSLSGLPKAAFSPARQPEYQECLQTQYCHMLYRPQKAQAHNTLSYWMQDAAWVSAMNTTACTNADEVSTHSLL